MNPMFRTAAIVAAALGLIVSLFVALRSGGDEPAATTAVTTEAATTAGPVTTAEAATTTEPAPVARGLDVAISVVGGKPEGGIQRFTAEKGERIALVIRSDTAVEVHVHGYDVETEVPAGGSGRLTFDADLVGRFEIELHGGGGQIAELTVEP